MSSPGPRHETALDDASCLSMLETMPASMFAGAAGPRPAAEGPSEPAEWAKGPPSQWWPECPWCVSLQILPSSLTMYPQMCLPH